MHISAKVKGQPDADTSFSYSVDCRQEKTPGVQPNSTWTGLLTANLWQKKKKSKKQKNRTKKTKQKKKKSKKQKNRTNKM